jgi:hypothetical protein
LMAREMVGMLTPVCLDASRKLRKVFPPIFSIVVTAIIML